MSDELAFLDAITANPRDTLPLLVFADWLDERNRPEQAEFNRLTALFMRRKCPSRYLKCDRLGLKLCLCIHGLDIKNENIPDVHAKIRRFKYLRFKLTDGQIDKEK